MTNALDEHIGRAGDGAVLMVSQPAMDDIRYNTPSEHWRHDGLRDFYRGARIELHDEWSWGWMVRKADGTYVESASVGRNPEGEDREDGLRAEHERAVGEAETPTRSRQSNKPGREM